MLVGALVGTSACRREAAPTASRLIATVRQEPRSFNRLVSPTPVVDLIARFTQATLVRVDRRTGELQPRLATSWARDPDGLTYTLQLRPDATFSDGTPFTSADVTFTFRALYDTRVDSPMASGFLIDGQPLRTEAAGAHAVRIIFPSTYGPGLTILDSLPILPKHVLEAPLESGGFGQVWNSAAPVSSIVGLGPFTFAEYTAGQRLRFVRNPRFWGAPLPRLDEIEVQIVPEQNAEVLRLQSGQSDVMYDYARPEDLPAFRDAATSGAIVLDDAGIEITPNALWFDLSATSPRAKDRPWLQREELRKAISAVVDRRAIVETVYFGEAIPIFGPVTPGHGPWYVPDLPRIDEDTTRAAAWLTSIGLADRNGDGIREDARGRPARFSILTLRGSTIRERTVVVLQEQLKRMGLAVDVVSEEFGQMIDDWTKGNYDAMYYSINSDALDPARNLDFWLSSGSFHLWNPGQSRPATRWEADIDDLMHRQAATIDDAERRRLFRAAQSIYMEHLPAIYFTAAKATVAHSARVGGGAPSVLKPAMLWNPEELFIQPSSSR